MLSKKDKIDALYKAYNDICNRNHEFICSSLIAFYNDYFGEIVRAEDLIKVDHKLEFMKENLYELFDLKPHNKNEIWYVPSDKNSRLNVINQAIYNVQANTDFTINEKIDGLKFARKELINNNETFICVALISWAKKYNYLSLYKLKGIDFVYHFFNYLYRFKPENVDYLDAWFSMNDVDKRINILCDAICNYEKELNN